MERSIYTIACAICSDMICIHIFAICLTLGSNISNSRSGSATKASCLLLFTLSKISTTGSAASAVAGMGSTTSPTCTGSAAAAACTGSAAAVRRGGGRHCRAKLASKASTLMSSRRQLWPRAREGRSSPCAGVCTGRRAGMRAVVRVGPACRVNAMRVGRGAGCAAACAARGAGRAAACAARGVGAGRAAACAARGVGAGCAAACAARGVGAGCAAACAARAAACAARGAACGVGAGRGGNQ